MSLLGEEYLWSMQAHVFFLCAVLIAGLGAGVTLYERFNSVSRRFFLLTVIVASWVGPLGMAQLAVDPAVARAWVRVAYLTVPLTVPALYWMALSLSASARRSLARALWAGGVAFAVVNAAGPWLVDGLESLFRRGTLGGWGWLGAAFIAFDLTAVAFTARHMLQSRHGALSGAEGRAAALLTAAALLGAASMLDYLLAVETLRAGLLTPLSLLAAALLVAITAIRYRMFAPGESFATDEVLRTMSDAVLVCDAGGRIRGSNPAAHRLLGRSEAALLGLPVGAVVGTTVGGAWREWQPEPASRTEELELRHRSGDRIDVSVSTEPIQFGRRAAGTVLVARDNRDRLKTERALQAAELRYRALYHHHPALVHEFDLQGRVVALNPAGRRLLGLGDTELTRDMQWSERIHPDDLPGLRPTSERVLAGSSEQYEVRVESADRGYRVIRGVVVPVRDEAGIVGFFGVGLDVTEEQQAKRELEVQRRYFADLFESSPEGIVLVEAETDRVRRVNGEFSRLFGYTADEAVGQSLNDLIVPRGMEWEGAELNKAARTGGLVRAETVRRRKDGTPVEVSVLARNVRIPGDSEQLYGIYRDIGDRKETERALREREEELRHSQKLEAVGKLAGGIAHDFNNLLTVINGHARFALQELEPDSELADDLVEIEKAGARAAALTQQLLAYSRRQVLHPQLLDPNAVVVEVQGMLRRLIGEHIRVETELAGEPVRVRADRGQLEQVLVNLVVNARDAMPEGGLLTLGTAILDLEPGDPRIARWDVAPGRFVRLRVGDTGAGMDADTLDRAFEPFFTTKEQGKGTGLGLATVFGIVKQSGGHVVLSSEPGAGTVCDVILPLVVATPAEAAPATPERPDNALRGTVLVVEDEDAVRKLAVKVLEREGCTVLAADNGVRALQIIEEHEGPLDLVLTDLVMPDMGGRELARRLRGQRPDLPVIFMSGYDEDLGADAGDHTSFLAKPFTPAALARRVADTISALALP